ncbi:MAG: hypothetical protein JNL23_03495 [Chitinophagaceae bacterium]|nr:hypothetical protein [Chitinophagaceae bacterium]
MPGHCFTAKKLPAEIVIFDDGSDLETKTLVGKFTAIQYHLHHEISDLSALNSNEQLLKETEFSGLTYAEQGIVKAKIKSG